MKKILGTFLFKVLLGYRLRGSLPDLPKYVLIGAPHTSNWDFWIGLGIRLMTDTPLRFIGKRSLFKWPHGWFFRLVGGIPINREDAGKNKVDAIATLFHTRDALKLAIAPEGTRSETDGWKTGYYWIAVKANVPIVPLRHDRPGQRVIINEPFYPTGNYAADARRLQLLYPTSQIVGKGQ